MKYGSSSSNPWSFPVLHPVLLWPIGSAPFLLNTHFLSHYSPTPGSQEPRDWSTPCMVFPSKLTYRQISSLLMKLIHTIFCQLSSLSSSDLPLLPPLFSLFSPPTIWGDQICSHSFLCRLSTTWHFSILFLSSELLQWHHIFGLKRFLFVNQDNLRKCIGITFSSLLHSVTGLESVYPCIRI